MSEERRDGWRKAVSEGSEGRGSEGARERGSELGSERGSERGDGGREGIGGGRGRHEKLKGKVGGGGLSDVFPSLLYSLGSLSAPPQPHGPFSSLPLFVGVSPYLPLLSLPTCTGRREPLPPSLHPSLSLTPPPSRACLGHGPAAQRRGAAHEAVPVDLPRPSAAAPITVPLCARSTLQSTRPGRRGPCLCRRPPTPFPHRRRNSGLRSAGLWVASGRGTCA